MVYSLPAKETGFSQALTSVEVRLMVRESKAYENLARSEREETSPPALLLLALVSLKTPATYGVFSL
jgi:hypothetical protein